MLMALGDIRSRRAPFLQELRWILVVEDYPLVQAVVVEALADGGFEPAIARSGEEATNLLREDQDYRALVTDINLSVTGWMAEHARDRPSLSDCLHGRRKC